MLIYTSNKGCMNPTGAKITHSKGPLYPPAKLTHRKECLYTPATRDAWILQEQKSHTARDPYTHQQNSHIERDVYLYQQQSHKETYAYTPATNTHIKALLYIPANRTHTKKNTFILEQKSHTKKGCLYSTPAMVYYSIKNHTFITCLHQPNSHTEGSIH